jgi:IclR family transcriptional regulator, pca regulon regulatory protein
MSSAASKEEFVTSLARGLEVIRAFDGGHPEMTLSEVATETGLSPAVARRFLHTLVQLGYAAQIGKRFILRPRILELGAGYFRSMNLAEVAQPHLQHLRDETGDTASLTTLDGHDILHVCHAPTERFVTFAITPGSRVPAYVSATGRAMLAFLDKPRLDERLDAMELPPRTERTVTSQKRLRTVLTTARRHGYALVIDELDHGITALGVPVLISGRPVAGVSCVTPTGAVDATEYVQSRLPSLTITAQQIAAELTRFPALLHSLSVD